MTLSLRRAQACMAAAYHFMCCHAQGKWSSTQIHKNKALYEVGMLRRKCLYAAEMGGFGAHENAIEQEIEALEPAMKYEWKHENVWNVNIYNIKSGVLMMLR